ncbi:hypothetical protein lerEdw1_010854 [Lerista edwardsae]|nr:hypothetical protein lerEdw1_010854 [Lerista edwardsae]
MWKPFWKTLRSWEKGWSSLWRLVQRNGLFSTFLNLVSCLRRGPGHTGCVLVHNVSVQCFVTEQVFFMPKSLSILFPPVDPFVFR